MSGLSMYKNLPGMMVEFKDGGLMLKDTATTTTKTESMLILGTAVDGPVMEPVAVDASTAEKVFGKSVDANGIPNGSTLIQAFKQAWEDGCRDIRLMRVTGSQAVATIKNPATSINEQLRNEENLGLARGNDLTNIELMHSPIVRDSIKVYVKGILLPGPYTVNETDGIITIPENVTDAGAEVTVSYNYFRTENVREKKVLSSSLEAQLSYEPKLGTLKAYITGIEIPASYITITGSKVKVTQYDPSTPANAGDEIEFVYIGVTSEVLQSVENSNGTVAYMTATSEVEKDLAYAPIPDTIHIYVNDVELLNSNAYRVDATNKKIYLKKEYFPKGTSVVVEYIYNHAITIEENIKLVSYFGGEVYNQGSVEVMTIKDELGNVIDKAVVITKPEIKKAQATEEPLMYLLSKYKTFIQLVDAINNDIENGIYKAETDYPTALTTSLVEGKKYFTGGEDGVKVSKEELFKALSGERDANGYLVKPGAYQLLENYNVDWVVPVGVYADDIVNGKYNNFAYELALFCAVLSYRNKATHGVIAMKPNADTSLLGIKRYAERLVSYNNVYLMRDLNGNIIKDSEGNPIDLGKFISVVGGPEEVYYDNIYGTYFGNPAISYASTNTILLSNSAPTNKKVIGAKKLRYTFSNAQLDEILGNRIVVFKTKYNNATGAEDGVYIVDGVTAALPSSDYTRITTVKVVRDVVNHIREVSDPFIGEPNTIEQRNALAAAVSKRLSILKEKGFILDYTFQIISTPMDQVLGQAKIELTIVPPQELRRITTVVGLKANL